MIDLMVAGGGPAGLAAAIEGAQRGWSVALVEPRTGPIDKACGEGLMPPALADLRALGIGPLPGAPFMGIRYVQGPRQAQAEFPTGPGLGVRRLALSEAMAARAEALGVQRMEGKVDAIQTHPTHVRAAGLDARWLIAADGLRSPIRHQLGLDRPPRRPPRLGLRRHYQCPPWSPFVEVHWSPWAEAYVTPVAADQVGIAMLFFGDRVPPLAQGQARMDALLDLFPHIRARLGAPMSTVAGAGPFAQGSARRVSGRVMLVGDASGYLDPLTGEGIRLGLAQARAAVAAIATDRPKDYERAWRGIVRRYMWLTGGLLWAARHGWTRPLVVPVAQRVPGLMRWAVGALAGGHGQTG